MTDATPAAERAFELGLDGVPWYLLEQFTDDGELPNFQRLRDEGAAGPLASTKLANTPVAWPSIASGKLPDAHGLYEFFRLGSDYRQEPYTNQDVRAPMLWDVLSPAVVGNVPMTYPAPDVDGTVVSGMMSPQIDRQSTHPPELADEIADRIPNYEIGLDWSDYKGREDEFLADLADLVDARRDLLELMQETADWRLFFFVFTAPDRLQHLVWDEAVILDHYRTLDAILGDVMDYCETNDATLYVVSDHGFGPIEQTINVNRILANKGYLTEKADDGTRGVLDQVGITKDRVMDVLETVGITDEVLLERLPKSIVDSVASHIPGDHALYDVDFGRTQAFFHGMGSVYVNDAERFDQGTVAPGDRDRVKSEVYDLLSGLVDPATGEQVLEVYDGDTRFYRDDDSPDLVVVPKDGYVAKAALADEAFGGVGETAASHRNEGTFFAWGPDVAAGVQLDAASVLDVTPTLLHGLGEPIPADADGAPLMDVYREGSAPAETPIESTPFGSQEATGEGIDEFDDVEDRLRGLGYVE
jgi:predicted AlkP superfamily phosphohydrolase/phosphomutase